MPVYLLILPANDVKNLGSLDLTVDTRNALKGDVTEARHVNWIDITSYSIKTDAGPMSNDVFPKNVGGDVTLTRDSIDGISPLLMRWSGTGSAPVKQPAMAIIDVVKEDKGKLEPYLEMALQNVLITNYVARANGGAKRGESFTLNSDQITVSYY
jgi:type VI protein secretion system component Hcp